MAVEIIIGFVALLTGLAIGVFFSVRPAKREVAFLQEKLDAQQKAADLLMAERNKQRDAQIELQQRADKAETAMAYLQVENEKYTLLQQQYQAAKEDMAGLRTQLQQADQLLKGQKDEIKNMQEQNRVAFRNMAQEILTEKEKAFTETNDKHLLHLLTPFKTQMEEFRKRVDEVYTAEGNERHSLKKEIERLVETSAKISLEANNLTNALKTDVKKQGNWGEWILETILTNSGLTKNREFFMQEFIRDKAGNIIKDAEGRGLQPDATIHYPDQRKVLADSKVSLVAWEKYVNTENTDEQKQYLKEHIDSLYAHIDGLSAKNYPKYAEALDYVLMFIPIEPAFLEALKSDRDLWKYAYDKGIVMVSPTNLLAVLKIIADLWKVEKQSKHAIEIADKAGALYDKFYGFIGNLETVGKKIGESQEAFDKAFKQLSSGSGNIIRRVEELKKMGARATKQLGDQLLKEAEAQEFELPEEERDVADTMEQKASAGQ